MRKTVCAIMAAVMVAGTVLAGCASQAEETTAAATTAAETTAEETTAEETTAEEASAEETTAEDASAEETAAEDASAAESESDEAISGDELKGIYQAVAEGLQAVIANKSLEELAGAIGYPCYVGIGEGITVENEEQFLALNAEEVFTEELISAVVNADLESIEMTEAGFVVGDPSGKPSVTIGLDGNGAIGITGINY